MFQLTWKQHGGSGTTLDYGDVLEFAVSQRNWWQERIAKQRQHEADLMAQAARR